MAGIGKASQPRGGETPDWTKGVAFCLATIDDPGLTWTPANPRNLDPMALLTWSGNCPTTGKLKVYAASLGGNVRYAAGGHKIEARLYNLTKSSVIYGTLNIAYDGGTFNYQEDRDTGDPLCSVDISQGDQVVIQIRAVVAACSQGVRAVFYARLEV